MGIDNSADTFKISGSDRLGTNDYFVISKDGDLTLGGSSFTAINADIIAKTFAGSGSGLTGLREENIADSGILARTSANETIGGDWSFAAGKLGVPTAVALPTAGNAEGDIFWDQANDILYVYNGTKWQAVSQQIVEGQLVLHAEYAGAVFSADGTDNVGEITAGNTGATDWMNYYEWNSSQPMLQDMNIMVRLTLPDDFVSWNPTAAVTVDYVTESTSSTNNDLDLWIYKEGQTSADASQTTLTASTAWTQASISGDQLTQCAQAGDSCVIKLRVFARDDLYTRVGDITLNYLRNE
jgi:hypothetical protein